MDVTKVRRLFKAVRHRAELVTELLDTAYPRLLSSSAGKSVSSVKGQSRVQNELFQNDLAENEGTA